MALKAVIAALVALVAVSSCAGERSPPGGPLHRARF